MADKTVGLTGRDFSTAAALASFINALALSAPYVVDFYNDGGPVADTAVVTIGGWTGGSSTNTMTLRAASGQGFKDNAGAATNALRWNSSNGAALTNSISSSSGCYQFTGSNIVVDGLQFRGTAGSNGNSPVLHTKTGTNQIFQNLIVDSNVQGASAIYLNSNSPTLYNIALIHRGTSGTCNGMRIEASTGSATNCTFLRVAATTGTGISQGYATGFVMKNCAVIGFATDFSGTASSSSAKNATDKGTFGGTNWGANGGITSITSADFVSVTSGSEDLRIGSSSLLKDAGNTVGLSTDIIGQARGATYDIGAWEYQAPVAPTTATLTGPSSGTTGVASSNFTITLDHPATGTINFTPAGTVGTNTFTPSAPQITAGNSSVTFTDNAASDGTHVVSITNDGGLSNVGTVNYVTTTGGGGAPKFPAYLKHITRIGG